MKDTRIGWFLAVLLVGLLGAPSATAQNKHQGELLLQSANHKQLVEGKLEEAIQIYKRVVQEYASNRAVAAKALVQMGQCYEKLGKEEARKAYERVVREYSDQMHEVATARVRLAALVESSNRAKEMVVRRLWDGPNADILGMPSPDGRLLSFVDWSTGDLAIRDLTNGENTRLTNKGSWLESSEYAESSVFSPDGLRLAYAWFNKDYFYELRLIEKDGSNPRVLYRNEEVAYLQPAAWSSDGKYILVALNRKDRTNQIALISTADGSMHPLKTLDWRWPGKMSLSPDGRYVVYDFPPKENSPERDIFLLAVDGSWETPLVQHPADDLHPIWAPDGMRVLFVSDRLGNTGAWSIGVENGRPLGAPELVRQDAGRILPLGFTGKGSLYYGIDSELFEVFTAAIDPRSLKLAAPAAKLIQRFAGTNGSPDWSPDGRYLAYLTHRRGRRSGPRVPATIAIRSLETGEEREFSLDLNFRPFGNRLRWSPDGHSLLLNVQDRQGRSGIYRVNAETGSVVPVLHAEGQSQFREILWAADGKSFFYVRGQANPAGRRLIVRNLETGAEKELLAGPPYSIAGLALSPDGSRLAYRWWDEAKRFSALKIIPVTGGEPVELFRVEPPEDISLNGGIAWTPDGRQLVFVRVQNISTEQKSELWAISAEGGKPRSVGLAMPRLGGVRLHPQGNRLAFISGDFGGEIWVMENFLPAPTIPAGIVARQVWAGAGVDIMGDASPDGRYLTYNDWDTGDLALRDLTTGQNRRLTNKGSWSESTEEAGWSIFSPDGKQVAYQWLNKDRFYELRLIGIDGSAPRVLYQNPEIAAAYPHDWSPDGNHILAQLAAKDGTYRIALISVSDGSVRILKSLGWRNARRRMSFSPDGRYVAFDFPPKEDSPQRDIFLLTTDGSREIPLVEHPGNDFVLGWTPDGQGIMFLSDRTGDLGSWFIPVIDGKAQGTPQLVKSDTGLVTAMGFIRNGSFYYGIETGVNDVYTTTLDAGTGNPATPPTKVSEHFVGSNTGPDWSPDGRYLAYLSLRGPLRSQLGSGVVVIRSTETGEERELSPKIGFLSNPRRRRLHWSPDGRSFLVNGRDAKGRAGLYRIDAQTGDVTPVLQSESGIVDALASGWSRDGKGIFYRRTDSVTKATSIVLRELETGHEKELYRAVAPSTVGNVGISPDGRFLVFLWLDPTTRSPVLLVMPASGGETRELLRLEPPEYIPGFAPVWTRDGRHVFFTQGSGHAKLELWRISADGGKPEKIGLEMIQLRDVRIHPDGRRMAFTAQEHRLDARAEVWVMENFLPALKAAK
ncbi:MAG: PD40 domain-containing protein [Acidobacteria bacterium]|nr:PD40 domain-containing protein [Acidobacteriota bacterium]